MKVMVIGNNKQQLNIVKTMEELNQKTVNDPSQVNAIIMVNCKHTFVDTGKFDDLYSYVRCTKCRYEKADYREDWDEEEDEDDDAYYYDE